jgi:DNA methyltransferase 1-associated protein 1
MTSHDVRDVLNLPSADLGTGPRPSKKQKTSAPRPNLKGLAREIQNLGGDSPLSIVPAVSVFKKRRLANRKPAARWELRAFKNTARHDDGKLILRHWRRLTEEVDKVENGDASVAAAEGAEAPKEDKMEVDGEAAKPAEETKGAERAQKSETTAPTEKPIEDSAFSKFNVQVDVPEYDADQYQANLQDEDWTKEETDYLFALVKDFDLRWPLIWDRYDYVPDMSVLAAETGSSLVTLDSKQRSMEDLKARYYAVASKTMALQKPPQYMTESEFALHETMTKFSPKQEKIRKEFAVNTMARSKDEAREEESLLIELKRILARTEKFNEERHELYRRLDYPTTEQDISAFKSSAGIQSLLQTLMSVDKNKKRRSLMEGVSPGSALPDRAGAAGIDATPGNRRDSVVASVSGHRDSIATPLSAEPGTKKKGGAAAAAAAAAAAERRKLSEQEESIYGVSWHERLAPNGPTFRYERINKLYSRWSGQQQLRMTNALAELDVGSRLVMPTATVVQQFEGLWNKVITLVEARKVADKLDQEIKVEEAKKEERDRKNGVLPEKKQDGEAAREEGGQDDAGAAEGSAGKDDKNAAEGIASAEAAADDNAAADAPKDAEAADAAAADAQDDASAKLAADDAPASADAPHPLPDQVTAIKEEETDKVQSGGSAPGTRPSSRGGHKRSASVLSATSDRSAKSTKSSKRQKR